MTLVAITGGIALGCLPYLLAALAMMAAVPRRAEGIRQVVNWPWPVYATLPTVVAATVIFSFIELRTRGQRLRIVLLLAAGATLALCTVMGADLLRRDYIGKF
ncbi:MAG: hypothetical protein WD847_06505 [Pirellulales bacterium]